MLLPVVVIGCATVDPRPDYQRASAHIEDATGIQASPPGDDAGAVSERVSSLLEGGLTVAEAVELCLLNNPEFQAAWMDVGMARADLVQSGLFSNPTVGVSLRLPSGGGLANLEASIAQNIADLWQIPARKRSAEHELNGAILGLARRASVLAADTRIAYCRVLGTDLSRQIARDNLDIAGQLLETAITRRQAGAGTELDVNLSRSAALEAELALETERLAHAEARRDLARLLGRSGAADDLRLTEGMPEPDLEELTPEHMVEAARRHRLDMQAAREGVAAAAAAVELEQSRVLHVLEIGVALERGERSREGGRDLLADTARASIREGRLAAPEIEPRSDPGTDFIIGPSIDMEVPVFDQNQARIARAAFAYQQAAYLLEALDREMVQDVRSAVDRAGTALKLARLAEQQSVPLARENLRLSRESYAAGKASVLSVLEAQRLLLEARRRHTVALVDAATVLAELEQVVGLPMPQILRDLVTPEEQADDPTQSTDGDQP